MLSVFSIPAVTSRAGQHRLAGHRSDGQERSLQACSQTPDGSAGGPGHPGSRRGGSRMAWWSLRRRTTTIMDKRGAITSYSVQEVKRNIFMVNTCLLTLFQ